MMKSIYTTPESMQIERFEPAKFAAGPHAQTILAYKFRSTAGLTFKIDKIDTPDERRSLHTREAA